MKMSKQSYYYTTRYKYRIDPRNGNSSSTPSGYYSWFTSDIKATYKMLKLGAVAHIVRNVDKGGSILYSDSEKEVFIRRMESWNSL